MDNGVLSGMQKSRSHLDLANPADHHALTTLDPCQQKQPRLPQTPRLHNTTMSMNDIPTSTTVLCHQNDDKGRGLIAKMQRRRPKTTLMDSVLRTPLKGKRSGHPVTPQPPRLDKKRKSRSASSSLNENVTNEAYGTRPNRLRAGGRSPVVRRTHSEPTIFLETRSDVSSPYRPAKRLRTAFSHLDIEESQLENGMDRLHLASEAEDHICGPSDCQQLMSRMKDCLDLERKARRAAEEMHLVEMQKRLEMERLVDDLRERLNSHER